MEPMTPTPSSDNATLPELSLNVLLALGPGPRHGYAIIQDIEERTGRQSTVRSGTLYATLQALHEAGLIRTEEAPDGVDRRRRYFALTAEGRGAVAREAARLAGLVRTAVELRLAPEGLRPGRSS